MNFKQLRSETFLYCSRLCLMRILGCMSIALVLALPAGFAQDSIKDPAPLLDTGGAEMQKEPEEQAYWKPEHFKNIPVEETAPEMGGGQVSFDSLRQKYNSPEFKYSEQDLNRLSWWDRLKRRVNEFLGSVLPDWSISSTTLVLRILAILGICALVFIIYRLVISGKKVFVRERREQNESPADFIERNLETTDIQVYLEEALAQKDFTSAIRYLHLINLQALSKKEIIVWDYRKTNHDFLLEIQSGPLRSGFERTSKIYEYIWFGDFGIDEDRFLACRELFTQFKNHIG